MPFDLAKLAQLLASLTEHAVLHDAIGLVICGAWGLGALLLGVGVRRILRAPAWLCRRIIVIGVGLWIIVAFYWLHLWFAGWLPPLFFLYVNYRVRSRHQLRDLRRDGEEETTDVLGHQWAPLIIQLFFWWQGDQFMAMAGIMTLSFGDSLAEIVGRTRGRHHFRFRGGRHKTFEGALAMFVGSFAALLVVNGVFAQIPGVWFPAWCVIGALLTALVATMLELYTPRRYEDFLVALVPSFFMYYYTIAGFR
jgi:dolichol kinase